MPWSVHSLNTPNFEGIIAALTSCFASISGVGTTSFALNPSGYPSNFEGVVRCIEDLNITASGLKPLYRYGAFYDTTIQTNPVASGTNYFSLNTVSLQDGIAVVSGSRVVIPSSGVYNIQFSAQADKTDSGTDTLDIWLVRNNVSESWSNSRITLDGNNAKALPAWNFLVNANVGDNFQIAWSSPDTDVRLFAASGLTNPTRPEIPSVILTVNQVY